MNQEDPAESARAEARAAQRDIQPILEFVTPIRDAAERAKRLSRSVTTDRESLLQPRLTELLNAPRPEALTARYTRESAQAARATADAVTALAQAAEEAGQREATMLKWTKAGVIFAALAFIAAVISIIVVLFA